MIVIVLNFAIGHEFIERFFLSSTDYVQQFRGL